MGAARPLRKTLEMWCGKGSRPGTSALLPVEEPGVPPLELRADGMAELRHRVVDLQHDLVRQIRQRIHRDAARHVGADQRLHLGVDVVLVVFDHACRPTWTAEYAKR